MWDNSTITEYIGWKLLDVLLKVIEAIIDTRINKAGNFHEFLHGFFTGRGTGTDIIELKLIQELASVDQDQLLLVFLDLRKSYGSLD